MNFQGDVPVCADYGESFVGNLYNSTMLLNCQDDCLPDCDYIAYTYDVRLSDIGELDVEFSDEWLEI